MKKILISAVLASVAIAMSGLVFAADGAVKKTDKKSKDTGTASISRTAPLVEELGNYKVTVKARVGGSEVSLVMLAYSGVQAVSAGEKILPVELVNEADKTSTVTYNSISYDISVLPSFSPKSGFINVTLQAEISNMMAKKGSAKMKVITQVMLEKGKAMTIFDESDKQLEVIAEDVK